MANTEIDSLSLNITISGLNDRDIKNLESLSNSIAKLQRNLKKLEVNKLLELQIPTSLKDITGVEYQLIPTKEMENFDEMFKDVEETFSSFDDSSLKEAEKTLGKINTDVAKINVNSKNTIGELNKGKPDKKLGKTKKEISQMEKTLKRIKLISFIKLIRGAINSVVTGITQSLNSLAIFDSSFNDTMSQLTTARTQIYNSLALIISPLVKILEPIITTISSSLVNIANTISLITAQINGATKYTKINVDYMNDYAKALQRASGFSFDTFNSLNTQDTMFETATIDEAEIEKNRELYDIVSGVMELFRDTKDIVIDFFKTLGTFIKDNKESIKGLIETSVKFTEVFMNTGLISQFSNLFEVLATIILPSVVDFMDRILEQVGKIISALSPFVNALINDLLPALLELLNTILMPINMLISEGLAPIIAELVYDLIIPLVPVIKLIASLVEVINLLLLPINKILSWIISFFGNYISALLRLIFNFLSSKIMFIIEAIAEVIDGIVDVVKMLFNMDFEGALKRLGNMIMNIGRAFAKIVDNVINGLVNFANVFIASDFMKDVLKFLNINKNWQGITFTSTLASRIPSFADGGFVGEVWQMNEYGNPEMLYNPNNNSNTSVINVEQLSSAFERAIINTGLLNAIEEGRVVYIDGKYVAQSKNFKNELNRTNPNLNIR